MIRRLIILLLIDSRIAEISANPNSITTHLQLIESSQHCDESSLNAH